jgi:Mn2+/Fe2+ NRAMP family transporter
MIRYWGPGLILTASVVGSGELIATTSLGASVGFVALWLILISCVIKVALQLVIGRYAIFTGETTLTFMDQIPGPRLRASWFTWAWLLMLLFVNLQQGAMLGGVAMVLNIVMPGLSITVWAMIIAVVVMALLMVGRYGLLEKLSTAMVASFTLTTIISGLLLQSTEFGLSIPDLVEGMKFRLPEGGVAIAIAVFGITGIGTTEIIFYPYWCIEKGYARAVGVYDGSEGWYARAKGWIRTMNWDAFLSMVIYTILTIAFYTLGAAVLHPQGLFPEGNEMIIVLSEMYTKVIGAGAFYLFLLGAFFALFSTIFVSVAANARLFADCFHLIGIAKIQSYADRMRWVRGLIVAMPILHFVLFISFQMPVWMVIVGGTAQTLLLPAIAFGTLYLRYKKLSKRLLPSRTLDVVLWISALVIFLVAAYAVIDKFN